MISTLIPEKTRLNKILVISIPIILAQITQNIVNLIDTAMVGRLGANALAAVGLGGFIAFMFQSLLLGIGTGVQAQVSRRKGEGEYDKLAYPLNAGLLICATIGFVLCLFVYYLVPLFFPYVNSDLGVQEQGIPYLQMRILGMAFISMNFCFRAYWNGIDKSKVYMSTLILTCLSNVVLNYILIFGKFGAPELGTKGAGIATGLSYVVGTIAYFIMCSLYSREHGFLKSLPSKLRIKYLVKVSLPNSFQQLFFSAGFTAMFWIIGKIGTLELAAANILINLMLIAILPGLGFGMANTTLVGQAIGRGNDEDAYRWGWDVTKVCFFFVLIVTIPLWTMTTSILSLFTNDLATIEVAKLPLMIMGVIVCMDSAGLTLMNALLGAGASGIAMRISFLSQWLLFLPISYLIGPVYGFGLIGVWCWFGIYRSVQAFSFGYFWNKKNWQGIKV